MKYTKLVDRLKAISIKVRRGLVFEKDDYKHIDEALCCMDSYIEPWVCPDCNSPSKIPYDKKDERHCHKCGENRVLPYAYIEIERIQKQMNLLTQCTSHYASKNNGDIAKRTLLAVGNVKITGIYYKKD